jgi:hypothetical protein
MLGYRKVELDLELVNRPFLRDKPAVLAGLGCDGVALVIRRRKLA